MGWMVENSQPGIIKRLKTSWHENAAQRTSQRCGPQQPRTLPRFPLSSTLCHVEDLKQTVLFPCLLWVESLRTQLQRKFSSKYGWKSHDCYKKDQHLFYHQKFPITGHVKNNFTLENSSLLKLERKSLGY